MATKKTATKVKPKTGAKKTIAIRSKNGKHLAGSVSLGGKVAPTAKKVVTKKATVKKTNATKLVTKATTIAVKKIVIKNLGNPTTQTPLSFTPIAKKAFAPLPEIDNNYNDDNSVDSYLQDITPLPKDFVSSFSVDKFKELSTSHGVAWTADILRDGEKVGTAENRGDGGANYYYFTDTEDKEAWEEEAAVAYADTWHEDQDEEDTLFTYLDHTSDF